MNPDNFNMSEQELNAQRRRRAENFKLNIDESEYELSLIHISEPTRH